LQVDREFLASHTLFLLRTQSVRRAHDARAWTACAWVSSRMLPMMKGDGLAEQNPRREEVLKAAAPSEKRAVTLHSAEAADRRTDRRKTSPRAPEVQRGGDLHIMAKKKAAKKTAKKGKKK
jgi:hypothetical protein